VARDYQRQLRQAIYTALSGDGVVAALVGSRIYQGPAAPDAAFPLIVIAGFSAGDEACKGGGGMSATIDINIYNETKKSSAIQTTLQIGEAVADVLDETGLAVTGFNVIELYLNGTNGPFPDPDPDVSHYVQSYRALAYPS
jgi:ABC-type transport system substrate-binding protein